jgi:hypothetical protein
MLKYFILILYIIGIVCVISRFTGYYRIVRNSRKNAYTMYRNRYFRNKLYDFFLIFLFCVVIILTIFFLDL